MDMGLIVEKTCGNCKFAIKWAGRNYLPDSIVCGATGRDQIVQPHFKCSCGKFEQKANKEQQ